MEHLGIKNRDALDTSGQPVVNRTSAASLQGFSVSFTDLLNRAGSRLEAGVNAISDRAGISSLTQRDDGPRDDLSADRNDDVDRAQPTERRDDHRDTDDFADARPDHRETGSRDPQNDHQNDRADASNADAAPRDNGHDTSDRGHRDDANTSNNDTSRADNSEASDADSGKGETQSQTADGQTDTSGEQTVSAGTDGSVNQAGSVEQAAQALLAHAVANPVSGQGQAKAQNANTVAGPSAIDADGKAAHTLELLRRDAAELAKALQDAGLQTDSGDLSFNLRGENAQADADGAGNGGTNGADAEDIQNADADEAPLPPDAVQPHRVGVRGLAGIDLTA